MHVEPDLLTDKCNIKLNMALNTKLEGTGLGGPLPIIGEVQLKLKYLTKKDVLDRILEELRETTDLR